jgi:tetratricopeptide (TPR) repeat protein
MRADLRGLATSAPDSEALDAFESALESVYQNRGEPLALIKPCLERWPDWSLPHSFRAIVLLGITERRFAKGAASSLQRAEALLNGATDRERAIHAAASRMLTGNWAEACDLFEQLLVEHPLDLLALHTAQNLDFFRGDPVALRNRVTRVLPAWTQATPGYAFVLGMQAFGLEECNQYPEAEAVARESLALRPENPWAVHALAHVFEMQGRVEEGIDHLESGASLWAPDSGFAYHNWWHLALLHLERCDFAEALALYDRELGTPEARFALNMLDAAALLWRLHLLGVDIGDRVQPVADWWLGQIEEGGGYYAFNDFHAAVAIAQLALQTGDRQGLETLAGRVEAELQSGNASSGRHEIVRRIGARLVRAMQDYSEGRYMDCATALASLRDAAQQFGGSHAQRDLITLTLMDAAARSGNPGLARHYLNEREGMKPVSALSERLKERHARLAA